MEVGAVKQAFNNEVIHLKQKLSQAKLQIINNLTRKAKSLLKKKLPEPLNEKLKRKAESAVREVMVLKKVKQKDVASFAVTHKGDLKDYLNRPCKPEERACARLLLHKALADKYKIIRNSFSNVAINDLLLSREERRKLKKEEKEKQKEKLKKKKAAKENKSKIINAVGDWNIEEIEARKDIALSKNILKKKNVSDSDDSDNDEDDENTDEDSDVISNEDVAQSKTILKRKAVENSDESNNGNDEITNEDSASEGGGTVSETKSVDDKEKHHFDDDTNEEGESNDDENDPTSAVETEGALVKIEPSTIKETIKKEDKRKKIPKQNKESKNKKVSDKIQTKRFKKDLNEGATVQLKKQVDTFFITSTGENYMTLAEPRRPDEVKEVHEQGNRQMRRAVMFGHSPRMRPKPRDDSYNNNKSNAHNNKFERHDRKDSFKTDSGFGKKTWFDGSNSKSNTNDGKSEEKLHPSWAAKKRISSILPFQGKKTVFDES